MSTVAGLAALACSATSDPHAGVRGSGGDKTPAPVPTGGVGIVDAAIPDAGFDCGPAPNGAATFTKQALLGAAAECAAWKTCTFQNAAISLHTAVLTDQATAGTTRVDEARASWRAAMNAWSSLELFQFGPAASKSVDQYHGRGLRTYVHSWPDTNRCQVETQIAEKSYRADGFRYVVPGGRGLFAIEYGLFYPGTDISCLANAGATKSWSTLSADQLLRAKKDYSAAVSENLVAIALELSNVWSPTGENFKSKLLAFEGYGSEQEALNVVAWSLVYLEREVKDWKVGGPAGYQTTAPSAESIFAGVQIENVRANIRAFRSLFQGCGVAGAGLGFDDWLLQTGSTELAASMISALDAAQAAADAFPLFGQASQAQFIELYKTIKTLTDLLKNSFFGSGSPLNLKLPAGAASDTD